MSILCIIHRHDLFLSDFQKKIKQKKEVEKDNQKFKEIDENGKKKKSVNKEQLRVLKIVHTFGGRERERERVAVSWKVLEMRIAEGLERSLVMTGHIGFATIAKC